MGNVHSCPVGNELHVLTCFKNWDPCGSVDFEVCVQYVVLIVNSSNCEHFSVKVSFLYRKVKIDNKYFTRTNFDLFSIIQCYFGLPDIYSAQNFNFDSR